MRKFIVSVVVALVVLCGASFYVYKTNNVSETYENKEIKKVNNNLLSMMLETSAGSGEYQKTSASTWPKEGYVFNETLSKCEQGSSLSWDSTKKKVVMKGNISDKCYVYFDKAISLAEYVKAQYTGTQGDNNMYYHDSTLEYGANDNSYRYAGSSDTTNNFICFGYDSTDGTCPTDYLYRIIGVFDSEVKLIKYDYAKSILLGTDGDYFNTYSGAYLDTGLTNVYGGTSKGQNSKLEIGVYYWNYSNGSSSTGDWSLSQLNTINLNNNYLNNIGVKWSEKILDHIWKVGGNTYENIANTVASITYQNEINKPATEKTVNAKVGLMYASDYGYAIMPGHWGKLLNDYHNIGVADSSWMYMGLDEWTLVPCTDTDYSNAVFNVHDEGLVDLEYVYSNALAVRPVLYLKSTVGYVGGSGTISSPILLN